ncbi:hypothetical protein [Porphyromonas gulae]|uniref:Uncharacterized protein n=1 Tax=Porphyromonas gulae TaxID=111105 RepID=A0A0A2FCY7_9PORP|nr:hypothetical protein [Porphyromonas gulae]KGN87982.1 hypothetical protein HR08_00905 [Porphyromonas gulae]
MTTTSNETFDAKRIAYCVHVDHEAEYISKMYSWELPDGMETPRFGETLLVENGDSTALVYFIIEWKVIPIESIDRKKVLAVSEEKIKLQYRKNFVDLLKVHKGIQSGMHTPEEFFGFYTEDRQRWNGWPRNFDHEDRDSTPKRRVRRHRSNRLQERSYHPWWMEAEESPKINADKMLRNAYTYRLAYCVYIGEEKISPFRSWVLPDGISPKTGDWLLVENGRGTTDSVCFVFEKQITTNKKSKKAVIAIDDSKARRRPGLEEEERDKLLFGEIKPEWFRGCYLGTRWSPIRKIWPQPKRRARFYEISGEKKNIWGRWSGQRDLTESIQKNTDAIVVGIGDEDVIEDVPGFYIIKTAQINKVVKEGRRLGLTIQYKDVTNSHESFLKNRYEVSQSVLDSCTIERFSSVEEPFWMGGKKVHFRPIETLKPGEWNHYPKELYGYEWGTSIIKSATPGDLCKLPDLLPDDGKLYTLWVEGEKSWGVFVPDQSGRRSWKRLPVLFNCIVADTTSKGSLDNKSAYYVRQDNWGIGQQCPYVGEIAIFYRHGSQKGFFNEFDKKRALRERDLEYCRCIMPRS